LLPHLLFSLAYLAILFFSRTKRDILALFLVAAFCIVLGLRDVPNMFIGADPVLYATILSYPADIKSLAGGADYAVFSLLHPITGTFLDLETCFMLLHLLFIPAIYLLFKRLSQFQGVFFLLAGWMLFVNSGLLLLANFFRQGICTIVFLSILVGLCVSRKHDTSLRAGALGLPFLHLASMIMIPSLLAFRSRHYLLISSASFILLCLAVHIAPDGIANQSDYFNHSGPEMQATQLLVKILTIYIMLASGYFLSRRARNSSAEARMVQRAAVGLLIPTVALLLTSNAPAIGLRYLYYSYALAFLYIASVITCRGGEFLFRISAIGICLFGVVTWTYPTVAVLLIW